MKAPDFPAIERTWPVQVGLVGSALVVVSSWLLGLWLVVVGAGAGAMTLVLLEWLDARSSAHRAATLALRVPDTASDPTGYEHIVAADLAAVAVADLAVLAAARRHAERSINDPWLRALAGERLEVAEQLVSSGQLARAPVPKWLVAGGIVGGGIGFTALCALAHAITGNPAFVVALTTALGATTTVSSERLRRRRLPGVLCEAAATPPVPGLFVMPEPAVVQALAILADGRPGVLSTAIKHVHRAQEDNVRAERRLADAFAQCTGRRRSVATTAATWVMGTTLAIGVAEVMM